MTRPGISARLGAPCNSSSMAFWSFGSRRCEAGNSERRPALSVAAARGSSLLPPMVSPCARASLNVREDSFSRQFSMGRPWTACSWGRKATASQRGMAAAAVPPPLPGLREVSSPKNPYVMHCVKLRDKKKYREEIGRVLLVGDAPVREYVEGSGGADVHSLFVRKGTACGKTVEAVGEKKTISTSEQVMAKLSGLESAEALGLIAEVAMPEPADFEQCKHLRRLVVLDGIQDPGNMGTIIRTAAALNWDGVLLLPGCCNAFNSKAVQACRAAVFRIPLAHACSAAQLHRIASRHQLQCLGAQALPSGAAPPLLLADGAAPGGGVAGLRQALATARVALVLGSEGQGLSEEVQTLCQPVSIAMPGRFESLNVGVAAAILMFALSDDVLPDLLACLIGDAHS